MKLGPPSLKLRRVNDAGWSVAVRFLRVRLTVRVRSPRLLSGQAGFSTVPFEEPLEGLSKEDWALLTSLCRSFCSSGEGADMDVVSFEF